MVNDDKPKRKGRGPGKKPTLVTMSLRLPREVIEYFNTHNPANRQAKIRDILMDYIDRQSLTKLG